MKFSDSVIVIVSIVIVMEDVIVISDSEEQLTSSGPSSPISIQSSMLMDTPQVPGMDYEMTDDIVPKDNVT